VKKFIVAALSIALPFAAAAAPDASQVSAICQARSTCTIGKSFDAGKSPAGSALSVVEVHLGVKDKPDDAGDDGCRADDKFDGGVEYWLIEASAAPRQLLKLCNDGYGASGVGEDEVTVGPNRLVHVQSGGSAWRWGVTYTYMLSSWRMVAERDCSYHNLSEAIGTVTDLDFLAMKVRSIAKDSAKPDSIGCPDWPSGASGHFTPIPAAGVFGAYDIVTPILGPDPGAKIPSGAAIGDCVPAMTTAGANSFLVYGNPAQPAQAAEIRAVAESFSTLVIQVLDPMAAAQPAPAGGSWINLPHLEIWVGRNGENLRTRLALDDLSQIGIDLDGRTYQGVGKKDPLPAVERWQANDPSSRPTVVLRVTWPDQYALAHGAALAYSQADTGKQARLVATTGIVNNRPLYVPDIVPIPRRDSGPQPGRCLVRDGRLSLVN
jgi:hypothetical protein